jgi:hypothetical protein
MLSAVDLESWSSHLPPAAPDSPVVATATALPHPSSHTQPCLAASVAGNFSAPIKVTALHAVNFYIEVSAPAKAANKAPTSSKYPSATAAITTTPNPAAATTFHPVATNSPIAAAASSAPTVSAAASTIPTASAAATIPPAAATLSASVPSLVSQLSSPAVGSCYMLTAHIARLEQILDCDYSVCSEPSNTTSWCIVCE